MYKFLELYPKYKSDFISWFDELNDKKCNVYFDINLKLHEAQEKMPVHFSFDILLGTYDKKWNLNENKKIIDKIKQELEEELKEILFVFTGAVCFDDRTDLHFYVENKKNIKKEITEIVEKIMEKYSISYEIFVHKNKKWDIYYKNFVDCSDFLVESIAISKETIQKMKKEGDDISKKRKATYWGYFSNEVKRAEFLNEIIKSEYSLEKIFTDEVEDEDDEEYAEEISEYPYALVFSCQQSIEFKNLKEKLKSLYYLTTKYDGYLDGWECEKNKK